MNLRITAQEVRLIASNGDQIGVIDTTKALELAKNEDLDLVEIVPNQTPPVCRIMDVDKFIKMVETLVKDYSNLLKTE